MNNESHNEPPGSADAVWRALADPTRRRILDLLRQEPRTTGALCREFEVTRYAVMKHLSVLEHGGLVRTERRGRERWNYLQAEQLRIVIDGWLGSYRPGHGPARRGGRRRAEPAVVLDMDED